jgi:hypothetical protein
MTRYINGLSVKAASKALLLLAIAAVVTIAALGATAQTSVPSQLNGLNVTAEKVAPPSRGGKQYLDQISLYSLRRPDRQLEGTLQIGRFRSGAPVGSLTFQRKIAGQIGISVPLEQRVQDDTLFVTTARRLSVVAWFRGRSLFILSIRDDYMSPKSLIRAALEITP